uniref:Unc-79 homolog, NALCN channel complex subunit n=1 Tax=Pavo cristatus TaxID=9049 RepID=A0A8C9LFG6_PAVCR
MNPKIFGGTDNCFFSITIFLFHLLAKRQSKAEADIHFASKIRYLQEYHNRVLHNIYPVPSGTDIANTLKYFSQTLLSILSRTGKKENQDASNLTVPMTMCLFPVPFPLTPSLRPQVSSINPTVTRSLLYSVLRDAPSERGQQSRDAQLSDYPSLDYQGLYVTLVTLLDLVPLLQHGQHDLGQSIFYTTTCLLPFLNDDILSTLPYTMISTLATFPPFLHKDIIEYLSTSFLPMAILGSSKREGVPAHVNLSASSMLMIAMQYTSNPVYHCQLLECLMKYKQEVWKDLLYVIAYGPSQVKPPAVQMLFHYWPNLKPPGAISEYRGLQYTAWNPIHCQHIECHNAINKPAVKMCIDPSLSVALGDKPPPLYLCEECSQRIAGDHSEWLIDVLLPQGKSSHVRRAVVTCFSAGCCGRHGNRPVRYCKRCHSNHHSSEVGAAAETHLYQTSPPPINTRECGAEELVCTVEAVISLLKEAEFHAEQREHELNRRRQMGLSSSHHSLDNTDFDNKDDDKNDQRLLSQFGIWFLVSLCTPSENTPTESLARLVSMVFQWFHSTAYMMDDEVGSLVEKLKPQFVTKWLKTVCDVRFDVMVMCLLPKPMEFARVGGYWDKSCSAVTQLKEGLNRILCLIPYNVINQPVWECIMPEWLEAIRTEVPENQLKEFREVLSKMFDIELCPLPFSMEEMFGFISCRFTGYPASVQEQALLWLHVSLISLDHGANHCNLMVSVASDPGRRVQHNMLSPFPSPFQSPFRSPIRSPFHSPFKNFGHPSGKAIDFDCEDDEMNLNCFILMFDLILKQMELQDDGVTLGLENSISKDIISIINNVFQAPWGGSHTCQKDEKAVECGLCQSSILCYQLGFELLEQLAPKEEIRLVEPTDNLEDSLLYTRPEFIIGTEGEEEDKSAPKHGENPGNHTETTENTAIKNDTERKFCYQQLPVTLKLIYTILQEMSRFEEPDILFNMLNCLKILCLHGECLYIARKDHPQFLAYIQDHMLISRFLDIHSVTKNHLLKYSLAHAFCCFLTAVEDVNPAVATRAGLLLDTIKRPALQGLCLCLDFQFDTVVKDRPTILSKLLLLHFLKADIPALSWEFFVNRFETLSLEAQLHLDCNKEFPFPTTITAVRTNVANLSDAAMWKIKRARFARNRQKSVRSLRDSVKGPVESKRALSLPETLTTKIRQPSPENDNTIKDLLPEDAGIDHQTVHQLITVLMKFMAKDESSAESDISSAKAFNTVKRHLYVLLGEIELAEYRETGALQDSILRCVREESIQKKKLRSLKQKSLDIGNADSLLFTLDEHRRKSCIDRCDLEKPPVPAAYVIHRQSDYGRSRQNSSTKAENIEIQENPPPAESFQETRRPVIPEVRLNCMETFEVKVDSPVKPAGPKEDLDLIDLSSDSTSGPEKHSVLSTSDSDSLVFEPLPPLRIVESDEEETTNQLNDEVSGKTTVSSPSTPINVSALSLSTTPLVQFSIEDCSKDFSSKDTSNSTSAGIEDILSTSPKDKKNSSDLGKPEELHDVSCGNSLTLKQKRDLLQKSFALPETSLDDNSELNVEEIRPSGAIPSPNVKTVLIKVPEDSENQTESDKLGNNPESDTEQNTEQKQEEETEESEFKIQIVPRQRKQRKIAVSAIQREYLDISFNIFDKLGEQKEADPAAKGLSTLEMPRESSSAPTLEAGVPETSSHSSISKQIQHGKRLCNVPVCLNPDLEGPPLRIRGATKSSLLSAPSIVSMFVPAPEEFADDQPTVMTDKCHDCGAILEEYDEETLGLAIVVLSTFIHLSPDLAAPLLLDIMQSFHQILQKSALVLLEGGYVSMFPFVYSCHFVSQGLNNKKNLPAGGAMLRCLENIATFMEALPMDSPSNLWTTISNQFQTFLTKLPCVLPLKCSLDSSLRIMICLLKIPTTSATRSLLEPFSKLLSFVIQNAVFTLAYLVELCGLCYRAFTKERDKFYLTRSIILELLQALKLKSPLPDMNLLLLVQFVCADAGTKLAESTILHKQMIASLPGCGTAAMECMRQYVGEVLDFIADMHTLTKLKSMHWCFPFMSPGFFFMSFPSVNYFFPVTKQLLQYLMWSYCHKAGRTFGKASALYSNTLFSIHIVFSFLFLQTSVLHMCSLFHAFIFAQLWTVYCEQTAVAPTVQNQNEFSFTAILTALEFWSRVTPSILQLMAHNKVMVEMVCLHVISLMEALQECNSTIFVKLIPMWLPMIQSNLKHLSAGLQLRLQAIQSNVNHHSLRMLQGSGQMNSSSSVLRKWLQCTQFKMAQVEIQSSEAASQFYPL